MVKNDYVGDLSGIGYNFARLKGVCVYVCVLGGR